MKCKHQLISRAMSATLAISFAAGVAAQDAIGAELSENYVVLLATANLAIDERVEVEWLPARLIRIPGVNELPLDLQLHVRITDTMNTACSQAGLTTVPADNGINTLVGYLVQTDDFIDLKVGSQQFELDGCFDSSRRLKIVLSTPIPVPGTAIEGKKTRDRIENARVVGGLVIGPGGESRAPISYGDFDGVSVMYLDVEEF